MPDTTDTEGELGASRRLLRISEHELQRIVLDLHDGPVQYMYAALTQLDSLRHYLDGCGACQLAGTAQEKTDRIRRLLEDGLNEIRSFIGTFRPPDFESRDLRTLFNGAGFDPGAVDGREHFGLAGMRDRMEMIGGRFALTSAPGEGTAVTVEVPVT